MSWCGRNALSTTVMQAAVKVHDNHMDIILSKEKKTKKNIA